MLASTWLSAVSFTLLAAFGADATQVMHRPGDFKAKVSPNAHIIGNHTQSARSILQERATGKVSVGYFVNWGIYGRNFQPSNIPVSKLTHILYSFADVSPDSGTVSLTDTYADQQKHYDGDSWSETGNNVYGCFKQLYLLKKANRNLKVLLSIGGYTYSQSGHFNFVTNPSSRATFVTSAIKLLEDNGLDGIDIDFEYPTAAQASGFASLLAELRTGLNSLASKKGDSTPYQISVAVPAGSANYQNLAVSSMDASLTWWNVMAYDYAGSWSTVSDDQANLYGGKTLEKVDTDTTIKWYKSQGATASKITMGIPLYGRAFEATNGIRQAYTGIGPGTWEAGVYDYKALPFAGASVVEDASTGTSYSYDSAKKELVSYDTPNIAKQKAQYIAANGLGGSMFWELSSDKTGADSLVAVAAGVLGGLDQTQNHLNYPGSQFDNIKSCMGGCSGTTPPPATTTAAPTTTSGGVKTTTTSAAPVTTTKAGTGSCASASAWNSAVAYTGGQTATYGGFLWTASWWTQNDIPGGAAGVWVKGAAC